MKEKRVSILSCGVELHEDHRGVMFVGRDHENGRDFAFPLYMDEVSDFIKFLQEYKLAYATSAVQQARPSMDSRRTAADHPDTIPDAETLSRRTAESSVPLEKIGDPFLAASAPMSSPDGKQQIAGVESVDLAELRARAMGGMITPTKIRP